nr:MAG TPA: hypothetical protein [Caudoviricetes sp.]
MIQLVLKIKANNVILYSAIKYISTPLIKWKP